MDTLHSTLLEGKRIFIVEDDILNIHVITNPLNRNGAITYFNYNSIGIEVHIEQHLPLDLILLDIMLRRGINGYETFAHLKSNLTTCNIPVVAVTSLDPETEIPKARSMGFAGFISKPISVRTIAQDISDILNGNPRWIAGL